MKRLSWLSPFLLAACGGGDQPAQGVRGIADDVVRIGIHTDLSGPLATWGVPNVNGLRMRFEEANAAGGVHGRRVELYAEDSQYQVPLAVKATNKLIHVDDIFAMVAAMGTPHNNAVFGAMFDANVPSIFPATAAVSMAEPLHPLKFSFFMSYRDQARGAIAYMVEEFDVENVCLQALATDYGEEIDIGFHQAAADLELNINYTGRHKISETDFTGTVANIKNSDCDLLVLGPFIKDTIQLYTAARAAGFEGPVVSNMVSYVPEVAAASGMDGLYAAASIYMPSPGGDENAWYSDWVRRYQERFNTEPVAQSVVTYLIADVVVRALDDAGRELTVDTFIAALESIEHHVDPFGGPPLSLSAEKHVAPSSINLYQIKDARWHTVAKEIDIEH